MIADGTGACLSSKPLPPAALVALLLSAGDEDGGAVTAGTGFTANGPLEAPLAVTAELAPLLAPDEEDDDDEDDDGLRTLAFG